MPRFFVAGPLVAGEIMSLPDDVVRHVHVLRLQSDDTVCLFNGSGGEYRARLVEIGKRTATVQLDEFTNREAETPHRVTLAQGVAGGDKMDWLIEKAVLQASTCKLISVLTRSMVRASKRAAAIHALIVPNGCSTVCR
ncbi:MAG: 16S rRNA (uracil(1498)-N(3))-methyltransferase (EC, partial [uncultured Caballeronia sp.]